MFRQNLRVIKLLIGHIFAVNHIKEVIELEDANHWRMRTWPLEESQCQFEKKHIFECLNIRKLEHLNICSLWWQKCWWHWPLIGSVECCGTNGQSCPVYDPKIHRWRHQRVRFENNELYLLLSKQKDGTASIESWWSINTNDKILNIDFWADT